MERSDLRALFSHPLVNETMPQQADGEEAQRLRSKGSLSKLASRLRKKSSQNLHKVFNRKPDGMDFVSQVGADDLETYRRRKQGHRRHSSDLTSLSALATDPKPKQHTSLPSPERRDTGQSKASLTSLTKSIKDRFFPIRRFGKKSQVFQPPQQPERVRPQIVCPWNEQTRHTSSGLESSASQDASEQQRREETRPPRRQIVVEAPIPADYRLRPGVLRPGVKNVQYAPF
ncbi:uncharacterized protein JCM6883_005020 [Sporobolomyces salmoneus]|uniref:uncharacterized protein n=1 Tax=Sporobolomyces salmoneus TaxID=183962 RepID=UPI003172B2D2